MVRKWFQLVHADGSAWSSVTSTLVEEDDVDCFRKGVKVRCPNKLAAVDAIELVVFANQAAFDAKEAPLEADASLANLGQDARTLMLIDPLIVAVGNGRQPPFFWRQPKLSFASTGSQCTFQYPSNLRWLATDIRGHYHAWREGRQGSRSHPLFISLNRPGTRKSRWLDQFPSVFQHRLFRDETHNRDPEMQQLLETAYTFKISFDTDNIGIPDTSKMIGTRMLYLLQDSLDWARFKVNPVNQVMPGDVLRKLSAITGTTASNMCVVLCLDRLEKLQHDRGNMRSQFSHVMNTLCDLVNGSKFWIIVACASTETQRVDEFRARSSQWTVML